MSRPLLPRGNKAAFFFYSPSCNVSIKDAERFVWDAVKLLLGDLKSQQMCSP